MKNRKTTSEKNIVSTPRRFAIGTASVLTATALVGVGAQGAFAATPNATPSGSGSASITALLGPLGLNESGSGALSLGTITTDLENGVFSGHLNAAKAQSLAKKLISDTALFAVLPSTLQSDVTTLANAAVSQRAADAKKIVSTALAGGYGSLIQILGTQLRDARGHSPVKSIVGAVEKDLTSVKGIGAQGAKIAATVTGDAKLLASLPTALQTDLKALSIAPASAQTADVQKIVSTALAGGYGTTIQTIAGQLESSILSGK